MSADRFPDAVQCAHFNAAAVFHPQDQSSGRPCLEVAGVQMYAYLDAHTEAVRVSVDWETPHDALPTKGGGVLPLRVEVGDCVVYDEEGGDVLSELFEAADDHQEQALRATAMAAGLLWACPSCDWYNPRRSLRCEGPDGCRVVNPAAVPMLHRSVGGDTGTRPSYRFQCKGRTFEAYRCLGAWNVDELIGTQEQREEFVRGVRTREGAVFAVMVGTW